MPKVVTKKPSCVLYQGEASQLLASLEENSVDLVVTSPPYDNQRAYEGFTFDFESISSGIFRVIKPGGVLVWIVQDQTKNGSETLSSAKQAIHFKETVGFLLHDTMIWMKSNAPPLTHNRYEQCWEYMYVFSKGKPKTFNPLLRQSKHPDKIWVGTFLQKGSDAAFSKRHSTKPTPKQVLRNNLWEFSVGHQKNGHPAVFPTSLVKDHILSWSNPGDQVLDPFAGSGTTLEVARELNRNSVGFEISTLYCDLICKRLGIEYA